MTSDWNIKLAVKVENLILNNKDLFNKIVANRENESIILVTKLGDTSEKFLYYNDIFDENIPIDLSGYNNKISLLEVDGQKYFIEPINLEPKLYVCGGGYVAQAVVRLAKFLKYNVTALEDRLQFVNQLKECGADEVIYEDFDVATDNIQGGQNCYFVILTRGHTYDMVCLKNILKKKFAYLGMMSSHHRAENTIKRLKKMEYDDEKISSIHTPIGLDIGAYTPEEIAVSILGEIIRIKSKFNGKSIYSEEILSTLIELDEDIVMATIIKRKGSTPCDVGTKMIFFKDGRSVGTIGGGCMEFEVKQKAMRIFDTGKNETVHIDMTGSLKADDDSMICGGINDVYLEYIKK